MELNKLIQRLPRHLKMSELRVFVAVLEHRSFRKAAAAVNLTQPAVTKAIAGLEAMLDLRLFDRHAHGVEPTVHGLSFAPRAIAIFDELRRAAQELTVASHGATGNLRIGVVPMPSMPILPLAIRQLVAAHPGVLVSVVESTEPDLLDRLRKQDIEVAIVRLALLEPIEGLHIVSLFEETLCVIASQQHPLARREDLTWAELLAERWVMPSPDGYFLEHVLHTLGRLGLDVPRPAVQSLSKSIQFGLVLHGGMLSFALCASAELRANRNAVVKLRFRLPSVARAIGVVSVRSSPRSPLAQQLVAHLQSQTTAS